MTENELRIEILKDMIAAKSVVITQNHFIRKPKLKSFLDEMRKDGLIDAVSNSSYVIYYATNAGRNFVT